MDTPVFFLKEKVMFAHNLNWDGLGGRGHFKLCMKILENDQCLIFGPFLY